MYWRKSSYSFSNGNCVEVGSWRKSSHSFSNGNCVEAGQGQGSVAVRDSKLAVSPVLTFSAGTWTAFTEQVKRAT